jgi:hypothetical protein
LGNDVTGEGSEEKESIQHTRMGESANEPGDRIRRVVPDLAGAALLLMALISLFALATDVSNYIASLESARGLSLEIASLEIIDDDNPRAVIRFRVRNDSPLGVELERYFFNVYLNGELISASYSTYSGTDPNVNLAARQQAHNINRILDPRQDLLLEFTVYIYSAQMDIVRRAQRSGSMSWRVIANFTVYLPHSHEADFLRLQAWYEE